MATTFKEVRDILNKIVENWSAGNGAPADLLGAHGQTFKWGTAEELRNAVARGKPLIQPESMAAGLGRTANLVVALTEGVAPFPRMPIGGLDSSSGTYLAIDSEEVKTIISWIEEGCVP